MDINKVNNLLGRVRVKLESLDPSNLNEMEMQVSANYDSDTGSVNAAKKKLQDLLDKLSANRSDSNRVRATGTKR